MKSVCVVHMDLGSKGGGEAVAMNVLEALQADYDVTLLTLTDTDLGALNEYFNTGVDVDALTVERAGRLAPALNDRYGVKYYVLQNALLAREARRRADEFDLLLSTINELGLPAGSVEYVHFPFDWAVNLDNRGDVFHPTLDGDSMYEQLCTRVADVRAEDMRENRVFANSEWTADAFENAYGTRPEVLYPPVDTTEFTDRPWDVRENGFVTIGRIERSKCIIELIRIVDGVRERGHDVHFHVVGPTADEKYGREVADMAADREYVELEGELPRSDLVDLVCSHRYGLHGKQHEHFGMAVAELAAAGAIPFIPSDGGQHAIVRDDPRLLYDSISDAIPKVDQVLSAPALQRELRMGTQEITRRFGRDRFRASIRSTVADSLSETRPVHAPVHPPADEVPSADD